MVLIPQTSSTLVMNVVFMLLGRRGVAALGAHLLEVLFARLFQLGAHSRPGIPRASDGKFPTVCNHMSQASRNIYVFS